MTAKLPEAVVEENLKSIPMKKLGKVEDVANLVRFLASDDASYITGQVICVDGGMANVGGKMSRRVVITGLGTVNPLGNNVETTWDNVKKVSAELMRLQELIRRTMQ